MKRPHENLMVWQKGIDLVEFVYTQVCPNLPADEKFGLISQLKRASVSVPTNISEGAVRKTEKEFLYFLNVARGSLSELDTLMTIVIRLGFNSESTFVEWEKRSGQVSAMLQGLITSIKTRT